MKYLVWAFCLCFVFSTYGQSVKYWVYFKDKQTQNYDYKQHLSLQTIQNRLQHHLALWQYTDIPLNNDYVQKVGSMATQVVCHSKWLNAVSAVLTNEEIEAIKKLPFVAQVVPMNVQTKIQRTSKNENFGLPIKEMNAEAFVKAGLNGEGVVIGVIDAGYVGAMENKNLMHLFDEKRILGVKDLVNPKRTNHYINPETDSDDHGNTVLQMITGVEKGVMQYGFATGSKFYLARTDDGDKEFRGEEDYWVTSMEWLDSLGVRLINTSLGYAVGFDNPKENYKPEQMDGKTSVISRAAQIAVDDKGILVIVSAGNEGYDDNWQIVATPADCQGVISVGATYNKGLKASYSSIGPEFLSYLKPNVSCFSLSGTSFSAPVITGFAACLMQKLPQASNKQLFILIEQCSSLYPYGNNYVGYGIPKADIALKLANNEMTPKDFETKEVNANDFYSISLENPNSIPLVFHKKNERIVIEQEILRADDKKVVIKRYKNAVRSTIHVENKTIEVFWKEGKTLSRKERREAKKRLKEQQSN
jgi:hypothetical protein